MELEALIRVMRAFGVQSEPVVGRSYAVRFMGSPYNPFVEDCRSIQVTAHNKGRLVSPLVIKSVLEKFEIKEPDFIEEVHRDSRNPKFEFPEHPTEEDRPPTIQ